ncbi:MAG: hypothetical protein ACREVQ_10540 [Burkholderiales bacterium]
MLAPFGSFLQSVAIMTSLPLSLVGVVLALLVSRSMMNISAARPGQSALVN